MAGVKGIGQAFNVGGKAQAAGVCFEREVHRRFNCCPDPFFITRYLKEGFRFSVPGLLTTIASLSHESFVTPGNRQL